MAYRALLDVKPERVGERPRSHPRTTWVTRMILSQCTPFLLSAPDAAWFSKCCVESSPSDLGTRGVVNLRKKTAGLRHSSTYSMPEPP
jgi:hypothetical protein